jgi:signal transduction histidine kinase
MQTIVQLAGKMDGVIEGLLGYSELGHAPIRRSAADLNDLFAHAIDLVRVEIEHTGTQVRIPRRLPKLDCDVRWTSQILFNLISNAIKYNDKPERWIEIGFQEHKVKPTVLYVKDNGIGIAPENSEAIFRLFHRLHTDREYGGGTGLGLAIVARAIERHNGRLWLESAMGIGTTFYFTLNGEAE